jgi:thiosulfate dehydrogenase
MRAPTALEVIIASAAVGVLVLFTKHPEPTSLLQSPPSIVSASTRSTTNATVGMANTAPSDSASLTPASDLPPWQVPDPENLPDDPFGRSVRYGRDLIAHTSTLIGPDATDASMRYSGNGLECQSCHLEAGTRRFGLPLAGVWGVFPTFIGRENEVRTLEERINGCMERSMNGRFLPEGGPEMKALLAYIRYISQGLPVGEPAPGRGIPALPLPEKASNPQRGAEVFQTQCAICHQPDGQGKRLDAVEAAQERRRFEFPPLWGPESYNDGAGMARNITAADFIRANMPFGMDFEHPVIAQQDAFDVAAFINRQPRPHKPGLENDYPDLWLKPPDAAYPPFADPFPAEQHSLGPWSPIQQWLKANVGPPRNASDTVFSPQTIGAKSNGSIQTR